MIVTLVYLYCAVSRSKKQIQRTATDRKRKKFPTERNDQKKERIPTDTTKRKRKKIPTTKSGMKGYESIKRETQSNPDKEKELTQRGTSTERNESTEIGTQQESDRKNHSLR